MTRTTFCESFRTPLHAPSDRCPALVKFDDPPYFLGIQAGMSSPLIEFEDSLDIGIAFQPEGVALAPAAVGRVKIFAMAMTVSLHPPLRVAHLATPLELIGTRGETIWPGQVMIRAASGIVHCELLDKGKEKVPTRKLAPPAPVGQATATPALAFVAIVGDYEVIGCS